MLATKTDRLINEICVRYLENCLTQEEFMAKGREIFKTVIKKCKKRRIDYGYIISMIDYVSASNKATGKRINTDLVVENYLVSRQENKSLQQQQSIYAMYQTTEMIKILMVLCENYDCNLYELLL